MNPNDSGLGFMNLTGLCLGGHGGAFGDTWAVFDTIAEIGCLLVRCAIV